MDDLTDYNPLTSPPVLAQPLQGPQVQAPAPGYLSPEPAAVTLTPAQIRDQVLARIQSGESPDYNTIYGGQKFSSYADHPRIDVPILDSNGRPTGKTSSAAGAFQFLGSTWDQQKQKLGLKDFSPPNQRLAAWDLAQTQYKKQTGRALLDDGATGKIDYSALGGTWSSLVKGGGSRAAPAGGSSGANSSVIDSTSGDGGSSGSGIDPQLARNLQTLRMMQMLAPQHQFIPVQYDPWHLAPKVQ